MNVSFVTLPKTYLSKLRGVNQTCIVFCPNNVDSLPEMMSTNCRIGGGATDPPSRTRMLAALFGGPSTPTMYVGHPDDDFRFLRICFTSRGTD